MKFCKNCGKELNDALRFCPGCGTPCGNFEAANAPSIPRVVPSSGNPFIDLLCKNSTSLSFLIFLLLYGASLLCGVIASFNARMPGLDLLDEIGSYLGFSSFDLIEENPFIDVINNWFKALSFIGLIPVILIFVGSLIFYMRSRSNNNLKSPADGLKFIKIPVIFYLVIDVIAVVICLLAGFLLSGGFEEPLVFIVAFIISLMFILGTVYYSMINRVIKGISKSIITGTCCISSKVIIAVVVFNFIWALKALIFGSGFFGRIVDAAAIIAITVCLMTFSSGLNTLDMQKAIQPAPKTNYTM